jgi:hypothetical protein
MTTSTIRTLAATVSTLALVGGFISTPQAAQAKTVRTANVIVENARGCNIDFVTVAHMYSDNYKEAQSWRNIPNGQSTSTGMSVTYHTGLGTTGTDWWRVMFRCRGSKTIYVTNPQNFRSIIDGAEKLGPAVLTYAGASGGGAAGTFFGGPGGGVVGGKIGGVAGQMLGSALFNGTSTAGFKMHTLRGGDEASRGRPTIVKIKKSEVCFISPSGPSCTGLKAT